MNDGSNFIQLDENAWEVEYLEDSFMSPQNEMSQSTPVTSSTKRRTSRKRKNVDDICDETMNNFLKSVTKINERVAELSQSEDSVYVAGFHDKLKQLSPSTKQKLKLEFDTRLLEELKKIQ